MPIELKVPEVGESITQVEVGEWRRSAGDRVERDEVVALLETDKVSVELFAPAAGTITRILVPAGASAAVGQAVALLETADEGARESKDSPPVHVTEPPKSPRQSPASAGVDPHGGAPAEDADAKRPRVEEDDARRPRVEEEDAKRPRVEEDARRPRAEEARSGFARVMPSARRVLRERGLTPEEVVPTGPGGRLLKEDVLRHELQPHVNAARGPDAPPAERATSSDRARGEEIVPMTPLRRRVAERLVEAQRGAALLTTFNEIDMSVVQALRQRYKDAFSAKYGVKLGLMSFFVKATVEALKQLPQVNAEIRGTDVVFKNYYDIGVAIGGGRGLVVPVLRSAERLGLGEIERAIADYADRARDNKLRLEELQGGTFTISNGGVYGSLLSTPIVNPPQSGVLGLHAIQDRPVVRDGQVVVRPMMYIALTYDHRIVDGREAVTFLRTIKDHIEDPARILLEV